MEPGHLHHLSLTRPSSANARRLKSRHPFAPATQQHISSSDNNKIRAAQWVDYQCNAEWTDSPTRLCIFITDTGTHSHGMALPRRAWVRLNRLHTGVGRFRSCLYKWGMASSAACECGVEEQTVGHVVLRCPVHRPPHGLHGLTVLDHETIERLPNTMARDLVRPSSGFNNSLKRRRPKSASAPGGAARNALQLCHKAGYCDVTIAAANSSM